MSPDATTAFARTVVDEWHRHGVRHAVVAPGSRSAPLALALAGEPAIEVHVVLDERSAAFFALGVGRATGTPAVVLCTSGTAAANFHPAVLEADLGHVPLLVCTGDRPPELRDVGAPQTVDQLHLYGGAVRWFVDAEVPFDRPDAAPVWRSLASRAVSEALGPPAGPVHVNLPAREPLVPSGEPLTPAPGRHGGAPWTRVVVGSRRVDPAVVEELADRVAGARGVVAAGWGAEVGPDVAARFAAASRWPVLADALSGLRSGDHAVAAYDLLARDADVADALSPELVLRIGAPLTSAAATRMLASVPTVLVDPHGSPRDPDRAAHDLVVADAEPLLAALAERLTAASPDDATAPHDWSGRWRRADAAARAAADAAMDALEEPFEGRVARDVVAALPDGTTLLVGSSMPVRDVDAFAPIRTGVRVTANRGANGIDGFTSTALGIAAGSGAPVVALTGDLGFLHDGGGLLGATTRGLDVTFVVVDNDGGGIFSFLPQADLPEHFELLFGTPHGIDVTALAALHGIPARRVRAPGELVTVLRESVAAGGLHLLHVRTERAANVTHHREVWAAAAAAARHALRGP